jgi:hypothetical protein
VTGRSEATDSWVAAEFGIVLGAGESPVGLTMSQLIQVGLRRNPRRAQLLVSTVLGKHLPVDPRVAAGAGRLLGALAGRVLAGTAAPIPVDWAPAAEATVSGADPAALLVLLSSRSGFRPSDTSVLTLGFAETATSLGQLVADQLGSAYLHSTRHTEGPIPVATGFAEPHSHATGHLLRPDPPSLLTGSGPMVLVDDELSTGRTALNVIEAVHAAAPRDLYVLAGLVDLRSPADDQVRAEVARRLGCRIEVVSLVRGSISVPPGAPERVWAAVGDAAARTSPVVGSSAVGQAAVAGLTSAGDKGGDDTSVGTVTVGSAAVGTTGTWSRLDLPWPAAVPMGGRHGFTPGDRPAFDVAVGAVAASVTASCGSATRILIVGTEELMYLPLAVACALARDHGRDILFQSTTRSPVHAVDRSGYPIRRRIDFTSTETVDGVAVPVARHLYNAGRPADGGGPLDEVDVVVVIDEGFAVNDGDGVAARVAAATRRPVILAVLPPPATVPAVASVPSAVPTEPPGGLREATTAELVTP